MIPIISKLYAGVTAATSEAQKRGHYSTIPRNVLIGGGPYKMEQGEALKQLGDYATDVTAAPTPPM